MKFIAYFFCIQLSILSVSAYAETYVLSPKSKSALSLATKLASKIPDASVIHKLPNHNNYDLIITVGNSTFLKYQNEITKAHISAYISYNVFYSVNTASNINKYAVFSDPDPEQIAFEIQKYLHNKRVGYLYTDPKEPYLLKLQSTSLNLVPLPIIDQDIFKTFRRMYSRAELDALLISENRKIYNRKNILFALESLYRNLLPAISSNKALHKKGAMITVFNEKSLITDKTTSLAIKFLSNIPIDKNSFVSTTTKLDEGLAKTMKTNFLAGVIND